ncbi:MAG: DUF2683 family protein [Candidatus Thermoplasmatota archaeon]|nr:DUF2683 family protein [Candidatus Thermoplasmatota archaeon]
MVQAFVTINEHTNRVLNIIKAQYGLRNKSEAIEVMAVKYEEDILEPELKPSYVEKIERIEKQKNIKVGSLDDLRKRYE